MDGLSTRSTSRSCSRDAPVPPTRSLPDSVPRASLTCSRVLTGRRRRTMRLLWQRSTRLGSTAPPSSAADLQVVRSSPPTDSCRPSPKASTRVSVASSATNCGAVMKPLWGRIATTEPAAGVVSDIIVFIRCFGACDSGSSLPIRCERRHASNDVGAHSRRASSSSCAGVVTLAACGERAGNRAGTEDDRDARSDGRAARNRPRRR